MDAKKVGEIISLLRKEMGLTQRQLAEKMNLSDRTISKWERGMGCPDISLLNQLSSVFGVNIDSILSGELKENDVDGGNMKRVKFYRCPICGNIMTATGDAEISCCGRKLEAMKAKKSDQEHFLNVGFVENDFYITFNHEMSKQHYLSFISYVCCEKIHLVRLYPEQSGELRIPRMYGGKFYFCCSQDGLWVNE